MKWGVRRSLHRCQFWCSRAVERVVKVEEWGTEEKKLYFLKRHDISSPFSSSTGGAEVPLEVKNRRHLQLTHIYVLLFMRKLCYNSQAAQTYWSGRVTLYIFFVCSCRVKAKVYTAHYSSTSIHQPSKLFCSIYTTTVTATFLLTFPLKTSKLIIKL